MRFPSSVIIEPVVSHPLSAPRHEARDEASDRLARQLRNEIEAYTGLILREGLVHPDKLMPYAYWTAARNTVVGSGEAPGCPCDQYLSDEMKCAQHSKGAHVGNEVVESTLPGPNSSPQSRLSKAQREELTPRNIATIHSHNPIEKVTADISDTVTTWCERMEESGNTLRLQPASHVHSVTGSSGSKGPTALTFTDILATDGSSPATSPIQTSKYTGKSWWPMLKGGFRGRYFVCSL